MKVFLCLCACIAASSAGIIGYPVALPPSVGYQGNYVITHPFTAYNTIARPFGLGYPGIHGYPVAVPPTYFSYNLLPGSVIFPGVHYLPVAPPMGKDKPNKKKPGNKKDDKDTKEETTEPPKQDESETKSGEEAEELSE